MIEFQDLKRESKINSESSPKISSLAILLHKSKSVKKEELQTKIKKLLHKYDNPVLFLRKIKSQFDIK